MVPFIAAQSRETSVSAAPDLLDASYQRDLEFFAKRGMVVPDITASLTKTPPQGSKFTGSPAGVEPPTDQIADDPPDVGHDED